MFPLPLFFPSHRLRIDPGALHMMGTLTTVPTFQWQSASISKVFGLLKVNCPHKFENHINSFKKNLFGFMMIELKTFDKLAF